MMSSADKKWLERSTRAVHVLALYMAGEVQLTPAQFDAFIDTVIAFLEEANNHKFRLRE